MNEESEVQKIIDEISFRKSNVKNYEKMTINELSAELKEIMNFERKSIEKIEAFEKKQHNSDLGKYTKMICKNTMQREITQIQEIYLKKIDEEYIDSKKSYKSSS